MALWNTRQLTLWIRRNGQLVSGAFVEVWDNNGFTGSTTTVHEGRIICFPGAGARPINYRVSIGGVAVATGSVPYPGATSAFDITVP